MKLTDGELKLSLERLKCRIFRLNRCPHIFIILCCCFFFLICAFWFDARSKAAVGIKSRQQFYSGCGLVPSAECTATKLHHRYPRNVFFFSLLLCSLTSFFLYSSCTGAPGGLEACVVHWSDENHIAFMCYGVLRSMHLPICQWCW